MSPWLLLLMLWLLVATGRLTWFGGRAVYLAVVRRGLVDYHRSIHDRRPSRWEPWLRKQRKRVQTLLFESGQFDDGPSPSAGGRATKLNVYALESLEHWLSEHPQGMTRALASLDRAVRLYALRAARGLNPFFWIEWLLFFPRKVAARIGVAGDPEWTESLRLLYWAGLAVGVVLFIILFVRR